MMMIQELVLSLVCYGAGTTYTSDTARTWINGQMTTTTGPTRADRSEDRMYVEVSGDRGRVKPPESIVPSLAGRGEDGWRALTELSVTEREIRGRFSLNWINKPVVVINRMTGDVDIDGGDVLGGQASFAGQCERVSEQQRF